MTLQEDPWCYMYIVYPSPSFIPGIDNIDNLIESLKYGKIGSVNNVSLNELHKTL